MGFGARTSKWLLCTAIVACGSKPPPAPAPPPVESAAPAEPEPPEEEEPASAPSASVDAHEKSQPPSTATYEQAMSTPEKLEINDPRPHLNDDQLRGPMRGVESKCPLPANAKVTVRTAVQGGRAIGVTVEVRFERPKPPPATGKRPRPTPPRSQASLQREAKAKKKIATCVDRVVRALTWPPSSRRDSFTSDF